MRAQNRRSFGIRMLKAKCHRERGPGRGPVSRPNGVSEYPEKQRKADTDTPPGLRPHGPSEDPQRLVREAERADQAEQEAGVPITVGQMGEAKGTVPDERDTGPFEIVAAERLTARHET